MANRGYVATRLGPICHARTLGLIFLVTGLASWCFTNASAQGNQPATSTVPPHFSDAYRGATPVPGFFVGRALHIDGRPIANAHVAAIWNKETSTFAHSELRCVHAALTYTDSQGMYRVPLWRGQRPSGLEIYSFGLVPVAEPFTVYGPLKAKGLDKYYVISTDSPSASPDSRIVSEAYISEAEAKLASGYTNRYRRPALNDRASVQEIGRIQAIVHCEDGDSRDALIPMLLAIKRDLDTLDVRFETDRAAQSHLRVVKEMNADLIASHRRGP